MSEKYYTVQDKINGAFSTVNESDYKPYDPASGGSSFDPSVLEPYAEIENVDASLALKADKTELQNYTLYSDYEQTTDAVSALQNSIANVYTQAEVDDRINRIPKFNIAVIEELPTTDISTTTVYLKKIGDEAGNMYAEYIYVNNAWEKLGEQSVNLSDYAKKTDIVTYKSGNGITIEADNTIDALIGKGVGEGSLLGPNATNSTGKYNVSLGYQTQATGSKGATALGYQTVASGQYSHAEGYYTQATGNYSHAEGSGTEAQGNYSHAEGIDTEASNTSEHASGQFNISNKASTTFGDAGNTLFSVGNGKNDQNRHNAFEIRQNGDIYIADSSNGTPYKLQDKMDKIPSVKFWTGTQAEYDAIETKDDNTVYFVK